LGKFGSFLVENQNTAALSPNQFEGLLSKSPDAMHHLKLLSAEDGVYIFQSAKNAFLDAFSIINLIGASFAVLGILIAWKLLRNRPVDFE
jgi:hypothetical protein